MSLVQLVSHAWRSLRRTPVFTIASVLTLSIGIGASVAIFVIVNGVLLRPLPYGNPDRLYTSWFDISSVNMAHVGQMQTSYFTFRKLARSLEGIGIYQDGSANVAQPGNTTEQPQRVVSASLTATLIPTLDVKPLLGRSFTEEEDLPNGPKAVLISEALWRKRFGADVRAIGHTLEVDGVVREIVGVMPGRFQFPAAGTQLWLPLALDPNSTSPGGFNYNGIARLRPGVTAAAAERDLIAVFPRMAEMYPTLGMGISTQAVVDQTKPRPALTQLKDEITGGIAKTLWMVAVAAGLVLLVACANVSNLILVRADGRQRELAVREALGARGGRIISQFLAEGGVLASIAGAVGLLLATVAIRTLVATGPTAIPRLAELRIDGMAILATMVLAGLAALLCSILPALRLGRGDLSGALREGGGGARGGTAGRTRQRVRSGLVAAQIAIALAVLAGSGLLLRTFQRLHTMKPGFDPRHVATMWVALPDARYQSAQAVARFFVSLSQRLAALPGITAAGLTSQIPLGTYGITGNPLYPENDPSYDNKFPPLQKYTTVDSGYFRAMGIPLIAGRGFQSIDVQRDDEAIISRATAVLFWHDSTGNAAIGKRFRQMPSRPWHTVIGVVREARDTALTAPPTSTVYLPEAAGADSSFGQTARMMAVVVRTVGEPGAITDQVRAAVGELDPTLPLFDIRPMTAVFNTSMARLSFIIVILGAAAVVTLALGAIGLYGVMAYVVTLRTRELGVRIALGAEPSSVAAMMTRQGITLTGIGIAAGLALFAVVARFLRSFLFEVAPSDPVTLVGASLLLIAIALLASWVPARRASRLDPTEALRAD